LIDEGQAIVRRCLRRNQPGPYQLQAAINAVHADATTFEESDWQQIVALYDRLLELAPTPSSPSIVRSRSASATGRPPPSSWSRSSSWRAISRFTPRGLTCCGDSGERGGGGRVRAGGGAGADRGGA
jgi:hypothetical protein